MKLNSMQNATHTKTFPIIAIPQDSDDRRPQSYLAVELGKHLESRTMAARFRKPSLNRSYIVPVLAKALHIISVLQATHEPLSVNQISAQTGIAKTTVYRVLRTLSAYGFFPQGEQGVYILSVPCGPSSE